MYLALHKALGWSHTWVISTEMGVEGECVLVIGLAPPFPPSHLPLGWVDKGEGTNAFVRFPKYLGKGVTLGMVYPERYIQGIPDIHHTRSK